jgi:hypothetical protein
MRLDILNRGYSPGTKLLFGLTRLFSGRPVPDAAKLVFYRPDFYGRPGKGVHPRGDARAVRLVGRRPGADGGRRRQPQGLSDAGGILDDYRRGADGRRCSAGEATFRAPR